MSPDERRIERGEGKSWRTRRSFYGTDWRRYSQRYEIGLTGTNVVDARAWVSGDLRRYLAIRAGRALSCFRERKRAYHTFASSRPRTTF